MLRLAVVASLAALALVPSALADRVFHTSHAAVHAVSGAPLLSGFVNDIHANGPVIAAHEEYHLSGALPNTTFQVQLLISPTCGTAPVSVLPTAQLTTNGAGSGNADFVFPASPTSAPASFGVVWQFLANGAVQYETDCVPVTTD